MVDVKDSSGGSAPNPPTVGLEGGSSAIPTGHDVTAHNELGDMRTFEELTAAIRAAPILDGTPAFIEVIDRDPLAEAIGDDESDSGPSILAMILMVRKIQHELGDRKGDGHSMLGTEKFQISQHSSKVRRNLENATGKSENTIGPHTCLATEISIDHRQLYYHVIYESILSLVMADATILVKVLQNAVSSKYGFKPNYRQIYMPGTTAVLRTSPVRSSNTVNGTRVFFHRLFWTFSPCVETFKYCKSLISIDGTHLYGKYGGTLLMAIAQDGNSNILPVAFRLVEGENTASWKFFLSHLHQHIL
ncbi:uncharacterized protein LOC107615118 [Arachis ipaensis]|uniref:uncharacterized protein LOC107615118 n=1 Tax=Arachis ipaensis TaxID=130454 RepID=UPI0007AFE120|nr:uncharacterized protein LOC107615118 [Arachis ipaensis]